VTISQYTPFYVQRVRGGLVFKAYRLCVSLNSRLESNKEEEEHTEEKDPTSAETCQRWSLERLFAVLKIDLIFVYVVYVVICDSW